eukprot:COSAG02_NODE_20726_length_814_cov_1.701950_1_plen_135_part_10
MLVCYVRDIVENLASENQSHRFNTCKLLPELTDSGYDNPTRSSILGLVVAQILLALDFAQLKIHRCGALTLTVLSHAVALLHYANQAARARAAPHLPCKSSVQRSGSVAVKHGLLQTLPEIHPYRLITVDPYISP